MSSELYQTIELIGREKGLKTETIVTAIEEAFAAATRKYYRSKEDFGAEFDKETGDFSIFSKHTVVEEDDLADPMIEITLEEAREKDAAIELGQILRTPKTDLDVPMTRIAAQAAKQVIYQKVKEAERELIFTEYEERAGELLAGQIKRFDRGDMIADLGRTEGILPRREQSRAEHYNPGDRIRAILIHVERLGKGPQLTLSRASGELVAKLFEMEVPEIYDGTVIIVNVARDAGERSKVSVRSTDRDVDPVGACVGMKGSRVQSVIRELRGEKIDIVQYDEDPALYVRNALNPATINRVAIKDYETRDMEVIVSDDQLSLAIGRKGQNVRLASKLVGWSLEIKGEGEKKAEIEAEMELVQLAAEELNMLPGLDASVSSLLLDVGFRTVEEVSLASMDDLTAIEGVDEDLAIAVHDAAEKILPEVLEMRERRHQEELEAAAEAEREREQAARLAAEFEDVEDDVETVLAEPADATEDTTEEAPATDEQPEMALGATDDTPAADTTTPETEQLGDTQDPTTDNR
jgi:N utilization substance protein A